MDWIVHIIAIAGGLVASAVALYVSYRQLQLKEEIKTDMTAIVKENCASKDSFDAHVEKDAENFAKVTADADKRHGELREDIAKVERRVDTLISGARP